MSNWYAAVARTELEAGDVTAVTVNGKHLAIYDCVDGLYATQALCTHAGAALCDGYLDSYIIECPLHQGCFDIRTGKAMGAPVLRPLRIYPVREVNGIVEVQIE